MMREVFPRLDDPVALTAAEVVVVPPALAPDAGREAVRRAIHDGLLRPFDIVKVEAEDVRLLFVPFWRIVVSLEGMVEDLWSSFRSEAPFGSDDVMRPMRTTVAVCARRAFPYEPKLQSLFLRLRGGHALSFVDHEAIPYDAATDVLARGEIVEPDVDRAYAEGLAAGLLFRALRLEATPTPALAPRVEEAEFVLYPMYYARYTYDGEARRRPREELFIAISGRTGELIAATHPSAARSIAAKVRRLLSFDRRL